MPALPLPICEQANFLACCSLSRRADHPARNAANHPRPQLLGNDIGDFEADDLITARVARNQAAAHAAKKPAASAGATGKRNSEL
jgi:hypothetical protein